MKNAIEKSNEKTAIWSVALDCEYPVISQMTGEARTMKGIYGHWDDQTFLQNTPTMPTIGSLDIPLHQQALSCGGRRLKPLVATIRLWEWERDTELLLRIVGDPRKSLLKNADTTNRNL